MFSDYQSYSHKKITMTRRLCLLMALVLTFGAAFAQGVGIPTKRAGIGFGNLARFTGIRLNFADRNVEQITGVNVTIWQSKHSEDQVGTVNGFSLGLPMAMGHENQNGITLGILGAAATENLNGINIGGLGVGAGNNVRGFNVGGLGIGSGGDLTGFTFGGLGAGAGRNVTGVSIGGLGLGAGGDVSGFTFGGLGVGAGGNLTGISIGGAGVGAGGNVTGVSAALGGVGAGGKVRGLTIAGLGIGSGEEVNGINIAGLAVGSPKVKGFSLAAVVGGLEVKGITVAPAFLRVGGDKKDQALEEGVMTGVSASAYNRIIGEQRGVTFGVVNYTRRIRGAQFGLINIVRENPRGLRVLPFFNTRFGKKG